MYKRQGDGDHVVFGTAAGGTGDQIGPRLPQAGGRENIQGGPDFLLRVRRQADPEGIADALAQQAADADGGFQHPQAGRAGLGDSQVQRIGRLLVEHAVGLHVHRYPGALDGDADIVEAAVVQQADVAQGAVHQGLGGDAAVFLQQLPLQGAAVDADADGDALLAADELLKEPKLSPELEAEARYVRAKAYIAQKQANKALADLKELSKDTRTVHGAEAKYLLAQLYYCLLYTSDAADE